MRAVRLRSHAIGTYARPQTEAPRLTLVLALIAAAGVLLPWAHGLGWSKHGWSYDQGLITLAAAIVAFYASVFRADGKLSRRLYFALGLLCALAGLGATLSFYVAVVGSTDNSPFTYQLISFFLIPRVAGAIGLYVSMAGFLGQAAVLIWHLDIVVQRRIRAALRSPWTALFFVGLAAVGVLLPWRSNYPTPDRGWSFYEGIVALAVAIAAALVAGLRLARDIRPLPYAAAGLVCATAGLAAVAWFHNESVLRIDLAGYPLIVWWLNAPRSDIGLQESVSAAGFIGAIAVFGWQLWQGRRELG